MKKLHLQLEFRLYMSSVQLDRTHTLAKRGCEAVAYQGRKSCKISNMFILSDVNGIPIVCSELIENCTAKRRIYE